jgi:hypothetical protein
MHVVYKCVDKVGEVQIGYKGDPGFHLLEEEEIAAVLFLYLFLSAIPMLLDSVVGIATSYGLDDQGVGVRVPVGSGIFSSPNRPDRLWGRPNLLSNGYRGLFPRGLSSRGVKLTTHLQLVPRSRKCGSIHSIPYAFMA